MDDTSQSDDVPELMPGDRIHAVAAIFAARIAPLKARAACAGATSSDEPAVVIEKPLEDRH